MTDNVVMTDTWLEFNRGFLNFDTRSRLIYPEPPFSAWAWDKVARFKRYAPLVVSPSFAEALEANGYDPSIYVVNKPLTEDE